MESRMLGQSRSSTSLQFQNLNTTPSECGKAQLPASALGLLSVQAEAPRREYISERLQFEKHYLDRHFGQLGRLGAEEQSQVCSYMQLINQIVGGGPA